MLRLLEQRQHEEALELEARTHIKSLTLLNQLVLHMSKQSGWSRSSALEADVFHDGKRATFALDAVAGTLGEPICCIQKERLGHASLCKGVRVTLSSELPCEISGALLGHISGEEEIDDVMIRRKYRISFMKDGWRCDFTIALQEDATSERSQLKYEAEVEIPARLGPGNQDMIRKNVRQIFRMVEK